MSVSIDGAPLRGLAPLVQLVRGHHVGDAIDVQVTRSSGAVSATIRLAPTGDKALGVRDWVLVSFLDYLTPWFCILPGFTVAFLRLRDLLAWLLLYAIGLPLTAA